MFVVEIQKLIELASATENGDRDEFRDLLPANDVRRHLLELQERLEKGDRSAVDPWNDISDSFIGAGGIPGVDGWTQGDEKRQQIAQIALWGIPAFRPDAKLPRARRSRRHGGVLRPHFESYQNMKFWARAAGLIACNGVLAPPEGWLGYSPHHFAQGEHVECGVVSLEKPHGFYIHEKDVTQDWDVDFREEVNPDPIGVGTKKKVARKPKRNYKR